MTTPLINTVSLTNAMTAFEAEMGNIEKDKYANSSEAKPRNVKAAKSAIELTNALKKEADSGVFSVELIQAFNKIDVLNRNFKSLQDLGRFDRTFCCCMSRKSNTESKLNEALTVLKQLKLQYVISKLPRKAVELRPESRKLRWNQNAGIMEPTTSNNTPASTPAGSPNQAIQIPERQTQDLSYQQSSPTRPSSKSPNTPQTAPPAGPRAHRHSKHQEQKSPNSKTPLLETIEES